MCVFHFLTYMKIISKAQFNSFQSINVKKKSRTSDLTKIRDSLIQED